MDGQSRMESEPLGGNERGMKGYLSRENQLG